MYLSLSLLISFLFSRMCPALCKKKQQGETKAFKSWLTRQHCVTRITDNFLGLLKHLQEEQEKLLALIPSLFSQTTLVLYLMSLLYWAYFMLR